MQGLARRLAARGEAIRVAVIGTGSVGRGLAFQCQHTPGIELVALADTLPGRAAEVANWLGHEMRHVDSASDISKAVRDGQVVVAADGALVAGMDGIDVLIEASSAVLAGALHARAAIEAGHHVVMMNHEAELLYGPVLLREARQAGVVYTCCDGDQPAAITRLAEDVAFWGLDLVMLGNIKGFHDPYTDPTKIAPEADKRRLDHKMCSAYTDGSKLSVEMACVANGFGGRTAVPGMLAPRMGEIGEIFDHVDFAAHWSPGDPPLVDYALGPRPKGGVFVVGHCTDPFQQFTFDWLPPDFGPGPFYLFYRPFILSHVEGLQTVAEAVLDGTERLVSEHGLRTNVTAYAKRDLVPGDVLDGMGGYTTYGLIENLHDVAEEGLPQLLCDGVKVVRPVPRDRRITIRDVELPAESEAVRLYRDALSVGPQWPGYGS